MTTTLTPAARVSGTIKALEWLDHPSGSKCLTDDHYSIALWANERPHPLYVRKYTTMRRSKTLEAAKAAAQADYESCILAAIQPDPEPQMAAATCANIARVATPSSAGTVSVEAAARVLMVAQEAYNEGEGGSTWLGWLYDEALRALAGEGGR